MTDYLSELGRAEFSKALRGYSVTEVDNYISKLTENYSALCKENILLEQKLSDANEKIAELTKLKITLEEAQKRSNEIVQDAYENADGILFSIKTNCDSILREFHTKVEEQKAMLDSMKKAVDTFKHELFNKYKVHIELIEKLSLSNNENGDISADEYVEKVVSTLKRDISAEYGISLDSIPQPQKAIITPNEEKLRREAEIKAAEAIIDSDVVEGKYDAINSELDNAARKNVQSVMDMLSDYERCQTKELETYGVQLALNIDTADQAENNKG